MRTKIPTEMPTDLPFETLAVGHSYTAKVQFLLQPITRFVLNVKRVSVSLGY